MPNFDDFDLDIQKTADGYAGIEPQNDPSSIAVLCAILSMCSACPPPQTQTCYNSCNGGQCPTGWSHCQCNR